MTPPVVLTTKLTPPYSRARLVERRRLMARLPDGPMRRLTLVTGPAGYGKTSFLLHVFNDLRSRGLQPAWVSLDDEENDLSRFLSHVQAALAQQDARACSGVAALLNTGLPISPAVLRDTFLNDLNSMNRDTWIFLDDFHLVSEPPVLDLVNAILQAPLDHIHLVIASRHADTLSLSRLRAADQLDLFNACDLSFSDGETLEFFEHINPVDVPPEQIRLLRERTEGWAAGLQLAAIAMRDTRSRKDFLQTFSGENSNVADFLADEVIRNQAPEVQDFLLASSLFKRFCAPLCDTVTGRRDSHDVLDRLGRLNLFIFALDGEKRWYRYHHLFAQHLRKRLRDSRPDDIARLHQRASEWFCDQGLDVEAIEHAFAAGDVDRAARMLDCCSPRLFAQGQTTALVAFASRLPPELVAQLPQLQLDRAWYDELSWRFGDAREAIDKVRASLSQRMRAARENGPEAEVDHGITFLQAKLAHREMMLALFADDMLTTRTKAREWLEAEQTKEPFMCASAGTALLLANREQYRCEGTAPAARTLRERFVQSGALYGIAFHESVVGGTFLLRGELAQAEAAYDRGRTAAAQLHGKGSPLHSMPSLMLAEVCYEQNRIDEARALFAETDITAGLGFVDKLIAGFVTQARLAALDGRNADADATLEEARYFAEQLQFSRLLAHVMHEQVRMLIARGQAREAVRMLRAPRCNGLLDGPPRPGDDVTTRHEALALSCARVWIDTGRTSEAISLLKQWYSFTHARNCNRSTIRLGVALARAHLRAGNRLSAQRIMLEALRMGEAGRFVRAFLDEGQNVTDLIAEIAKTDLSAHSFSAGYLERLLGPRATDPGIRLPPHLVPPPEVDSSEGATEREMQILRLGSRGMANNDIATALCLAESTVKWYWQRIFDKLEVRRRSEAIRRARHLHWIS
jgi:LuxR family transcriptional regulator, maltose regulon positive regulatory protein